MTALNLKNTGTKIDMNVAETILSQLGGSRFTVMTGAHNFSSDGTMLQFGIKAVNKIRCNAMMIRYNKGSDTYTVIFNRFTMPKMNMKTGKMTGGFVVLKKIEDVYCDSLQEVFTRHTGLYTSI